MDIKVWKKKIAAVLREHPNITNDTTGQIEINVNRGSVTKLYRVETITEEDGAVKITTKKELK